jgi:hypothetical protein
VIPETLAEKTRRKQVGKEEGKKEERERKEGEVNMVFLRGDCCG